jgi:hypothetical protein
VASTPSSPADIDPVNIGSSADPSTSSATGPDAVTDPVGTSVQLMVPGGQAMVALLGTQDELLRIQEELGKIAAGLDVAYPPYVM